jgi:hypothetical protein
MIKSGEISRHGEQKTFGAAKRTQLWEVGEIVNVGFLKLKVLAKVATPGNYLPDQYALGAASGAIYRFIPHHGITRCSSLEDAMQPA